jgi:dolichyl-phosphate-mannose--protein O-mannosyl transferase
VIGAASLGVGYAAWRAWRFRDRLSLWVVAWVAATYLSFYPLVLFEDRTTYLYYMLPALPAVCLGLAQLLLRSGLPRAVMWGYVVVLLVGFWDYYPIRRPW